MARKSERSNGDGKHGRKPDSLTFKGAAAAAHSRSGYAVEDAGVAEARAAALWREPRFRGDAGLLLAQDEGGGHDCRFAFGLIGVTSAAIADSVQRRGMNKAVAPGEADRQRALASLVGAIVPGQVLRFVHEAVPLPEGGSRYAMRIEARVTSDSASSALDQAAGLRDSVVAMLAAGSPQFGFRGMAEPPEVPRRVRMHRAWVRPLSIASLDRPPAGASPSRGQVRRVPIRFPLVPVGTQTFLDSTIPALMALHAPTTLTIEWHGRRASGDELAQLAEAVRGLAEQRVDSFRITHASATLGIPAPDDLMRTHLALQAWLAAPLAVEMRVLVESIEPVAAAFAQLAGRELLLGRPFEVIEADAGEPLPSGDDGYLSQLLPHGLAMPPLLPDPQTVDRLGLPRTFPAVHFEAGREGVLLGDMPLPMRDQEVRLASQDRLQHCYIVGGTGTGKSTLLAGMVSQDIEAGEGVGLLDPHGDLFAQVLASCPARRRKDVVVLDFTDHLACPGINLLECQSAHPLVERGFIIKDLVQIFRYLYPENPEAFGPMFHQYMFNAVALVMGDPDAQATLLDVPRVFADVRYRRHLLQGCTDRMVKLFWTGIALKAGGEASLDNIAPYITSKFVEFTQNELVRLVVGQARSTVRFRELMDRRAVVLVNLSKGLLSEGDTRFLGMVLTSRIFGAALSRAGAPKRTRVPFYLYIDEFQNFTSPSIVATLSEARKYGLGLTLAHQNLAQLPREYAHAVLANCGSKILFRVGSQDAQELSPWMAPHFSQHDMAALPDHHAVVRMQARHVPTPPFLLRTRPPISAFAAATVDERVADIWRRSRERFCCSAEAVRAQIEARLEAFDVAQRQERTESAVALMDAVRKGPAATAQGGKKPTAGGDAAAEP